MDRNTITGLVLIVLILFGYQYLTMPSAEELARMQREQDSIAALAIEKQARSADSALAEKQAAAPAGPLTAQTATMAADTTGADTLNADSLRQAHLAERFGIFSNPPWH